MKKLVTHVYLQDIRSFRWELYHYRHSKEIIKSLSRYYFKKYHFQHFAEEIVIAGYDLQNLNTDIQQEVYLHMPHLLYNEFPSIIEKDDTLWDLNRLFICLLYQNEASFIVGLKLVAEKRSNDLCELLICNGFLLWQLENWLNPSIRQTFLSILKKLRSAETLFDPSMFAIIESYRDQFQFWRGKRYINIVDVVDAVMQEPKFRYKKVMEHFNRSKCVETLLDWNLDVTVQLHLGRTALYHAAKRNNIEAIFKLLNKGSFIGSATNLFDPKICNIESKLLEKHFDDCITRCVDDGRFIEIDFKNLISTVGDCQNCDGTCSDEMKAIELISYSNNHKRLLVHPLIWTFVLLKWNQLAFLFHIHFVLYILFTLSTIGYIWCVVNDVTVHVRITFAVFTIILTLYLAVRRIMHQIHHSNSSQSSNRIHSYLECIHTVFIVFFVILLLIDPSKACRSILATICIMLIALELFILAGSLLWSFSKYYVMFLDVASSSIKSLQLCLILLPAFSMSFYLLLWSHSSKPVKSTSIYNDMNSTYSEMDNSFSRLRTSIIKIIAMSAGEFEAANSHFDSSVISANLFLGFLFLISIVFMNLMNGLAVSDTQKIQSDAEATSMIQRVKLLAHYEGFISNKHHILRRKFRDTFILKVFEYFIKINALETLRNSLNTKIFIGPDNKVLILRKDYRTSEQDSIIFNQNGFYLHSWISYFCFTNKILRVDPNIAQQARRILEKKDLKQRDDNEKNLLKNKITKLENNLEKVIHLIRQNEENTKNIMCQLNATHGSEKK